MSRKMLIDREPQGPNESEQFDFDLFVIGAGSGGVRASRTSAGFGAKVAICELPFSPISSQNLGGVGGTCVIRGCVPKKILVYGASFGGELEDAKNYGWEFGEAGFNWKQLLHKKGYLSVYPTNSSQGWMSIETSVTSYGSHFFIRQKSVNIKFDPLETQEIIRLNGVYKRLLVNSGVTLFEGKGKVLDAHRVEVIQVDGTTKTYSAKHILIATGSQAVRVPIPGQELAITSDEALSLDETPKHVVVLGAGYIAVEFASIWRGMGATVDLFYRKELPLRGFDDEMRAIVAKNLEGRGIRLHPETNLSKLEKAENGIKVVTDHGDELVADVVLFATGRKPNTEGLNLENVGVQLDSVGAIKVDEYSQTTVPSIWAVGDVTNRINLTPVALMEGTCFAKTVFGGQSTKPDYKFVPCAVFSIPPLSVVGLNEQEAVKQANGDVLIYTSSFTPMKNSISGRQEKTVMKLVVDSETNKVIGSSMCGPDAPEIMQGIAVALKCGATKEQFDSTVGIHPSAAEEFVTMRTLTRRVSANAIGKTNL